MPGAGAVTALLVAVDVYRPAAMDQLETLGRQVDLPVHVQRGTTDVLQIARQIARGQASSSLLAGFHSGEPLRPVPRLRPVNWFLRLTVNDQPGILARTAEAIAREGINIDSVIQEPNMAKDRLSFVITLEPTPETTVQRAVEAINRFEFMKAPVLLMPMISSAEEHV